MKKQILLRQGLNFYLRTYGCQMNMHDSEVLAGMLKGRGWNRVKDEAKAGVILLNTCSVRRHAEERVFGKLAEYERQKNGRPRPVVGVVGCLAQIWGKELWKRFPWLDLILGPGSFVFLPEVLERILLTGCRRLELAFNNTEEFFESLPVRDSSVRAWVTVIRGCDNFCSYCVVPFSRGREVSRAPENIVEEVKRLASAGYREVTLLGQNVNSYHSSTRKGKSIDFPALLYLVHKVAGIKRIRFVTSHPRDISSELIKAVKSLPKVCECLHFPAQSGSNVILRQMNRGYTREEYREKVLNLRQAIPGIALSSDFILGFPGETENDFALTMDLIRKVRFDQIFAFRYSARAGTKSYLLPDDVPAEEKTARLHEVLALQRAVSRERNQALMGRAVKVLVEGRNRKRPERGEGRTRTGKITFFPWREGLAGKIISVRIERVTPLSLFGRQVGG